MMNKPVVAGGVNGGAAVVGVGAGAAPVEEEATAAPVEEKGFEPAPASTPTAADALAELSPGQLERWLRSLAREASHLKRDLTRRDDDAEHRLRWRSELLEGEPLAFRLEGRPLREGRTLTIDFRLSGQELVVHHGVNGRTRTVTLPPEAAESVDAAAAAVAEAVANQLSPGDVDAVLRISGRDFVDTRSGRALLSGLFERTRRFLTERDGPGRWSGTELELLGPGGSSMRLDGDRVRLSLGGEVTSHGLPSSSADRVVEKVTARLVRLAGNTEEAARAIAPTPEAYVGTDPGHAAFDADATRLGLTNVHLIGERLWDWSSDEEVQVAGASAEAVRAALVTLALRAQPPAGGDVASMSTPRVLGRALGASAFGKPSDPLPFETSVLTAHCAVAPQLRGQAIEARWLRDGAVVQEGSVTAPEDGLLSASLDGGGRALPAGSYRLELRVGGELLSATEVRVGNERVAFGRVHYSDDPVSKRFELRNLSWEMAPSIDAGRIDLQQVSADAAFARRPKEKSYFLIERCAPEGTDRAEHFRLSRIRGDEVLGSRHYAVEGSRLVECSAEDAADAGATFAANPMELVQKAHPWLRHLPTALEQEWPWLSSYPALEGKLSGARLSPQGVAVEHHGLWNLNWRNLHSPAIDGHSVHVKLEPDRVYVTGIRDRYGWTWRTHREVSGTLDLKLAAGTRVVLYQMPKGYFPYPDDASAPAPEACLSFTLPKDDSDPWYRTHGRPVVLPT